VASASHLEKSFRLDTLEIAKGKKIERDVHAASPEPFAHFFSGGQSKICDRELQTTTKAKDVLWLDIKMIDAQGMAELDCLEELTKYVLDQVIGLV
jgi:hypothetical protein